MSSLLTRAFNETHRQGEGVANFVPINRVSRPERPPAVQRRLRCTAADRPDIVSVCSTVSFNRGGGHTGPPPFPTGSTGQEHPDLSLGGKLFQGQSSKLVVSIFWTTPAAVPDAPTAGGGSHSRTIVLAFAHQPAKMRRRNRDRRAGHLNATDSTPAHSSLLLRRPPEAFDRRRRLPVTEATGPVVAQAHLDRR